MADFASYCTKCRAINLDELRACSIEHHPNGAALKSAADSGCMLCKLLWKGVTKKMSLEQVKELEEDTADDGMFLMEPNSVDSSPEMWYRHDSGNGLYANLQLYWEGEHPRYPKSRRRDIAEDPLSPDLVERIRVLISDCIFKHKYCSNSKPPALPTRVIDVGPPDGPKDPHLVISNGLEGRYVALSYCWGLSEGLQTTADNLADHQQAIPFAKLPKTLQDAVRITRSLGRQYLWIDALCIVQRRYNGDPVATEDWQREASRMSDVYSNAWLTIAASEGSDKSSGILHPRLQQPFCRIAKTREEVDGSPSTEPPIFARLIVPTGLRHLDGRAWTLQEGLLSPRIIEYRAEQMIFSCRKMRYQESGDVEEATGLLVTTGPGFFRPYTSREPFANERDMMLRKWYANLTPYTNRGITSDGDRLPALAGLAHRMKEVIKGEYQAGLWRSDFINGLLWRSSLYGGSRLAGSKIKPLVPSTTYLAPSWSWASCSGEIYYEFIHEDHWQKIGGPRWPATITEVSTDLIGPFFDPLGQVADGYAKLSCPIKEAVLVLNPTRKFRSNKGGRNRWIQYLITDEANAIKDDAIQVYSNEPIVAVACLDRAGGWPKKLVCAQLLPGRGLILEQSITRSDAFDRIGIFLQEDLNWFQGSAVKDIMIV